MMWGTSTVQDGFLFTKAMYKWYQMTFTPREEEPLLPYTGGSSYIQCSYCRLGQWESLILMQTGRSGCVFRLPWGKGVHSCMPHVLSTRVIMPS